MKMNSIFSIKSSIALLVLGTAMLSVPKQPVKSTLEAFSAYQPEALPSFGFYVLSKAYIAIDKTVEY